MDLQFFHAFTFPVSLLSRPLYLLAFLLFTLLLGTLSFNVYGIRERWPFRAGASQHDGNIMAVKQTATAPDGPTGDFKGDIKVNDDPPTKVDLEKAGSIEVFDKDKKKRTFGSLYADNGARKRRILVLFIRHFFCGVGFSSLLPLPAPDIMGLSCSQVSHRTAKNISVPSRSLYLRLYSPPFQPLRI